MSGGSLETDNKAGGGEGEVSVGGEESEPPED